MSYAIIGYCGTSEFREELTATSFDEICRAKETSLLGLELEEKINLLLDNHYELEVELLSLAEANRIWPERQAVDAMRERMVLDRRIVNLLTACRLYLDHSCHTASFLFGKDSAGLKLVNERTHKAYDGVFGYRLMEALRNYVQHRGLLVHLITYERNLVPHDARPFIQFTVAPKLDISILGEDTKFKSSILEEAKTVGGLIDLRWPVREYVSTILSLHIALRNEITSSFGDRMTHYRSSVEKYKQSGDTPIIYPRAVELDDQGHCIREVALVDHLLQHYDALCQKNKASVDLVGSYSSSYCKPDKLRRGVSESQNR